MKNIMSKILRVNLSTGKISTEPTDLNMVENFYGGRGIGIRMLWEEVNPEVTPFSPQNKLIFFASPLVGTRMPGANKLALTFKSPLTSGCFVTLCGGYMAPELRFAGYDGLIIEGKSEKPAYLCIKDDEVSLRSASDIWGKFTRDTDHAIKEIEGDQKLRIACIGPAGEKLVKYACIQSDLHREFGRGGGGAVMGSKGLKAIAIRGSHPVEVESPDLLKKLASEVVGELNRNKKAQVRREYGTLENASWVNELGFLPVRNFTQGVFKQIEEIDMYKLKSDFVPKNWTCFACPVACGKVCSFRASDGTIQSVSPEYESIIMLGSNCGISSFNTILEMLLLCDLYGLDTMSTGTAISMVMEAFEKKLINKKTTDGLTLNFGCAEESLELISKIGKREGIGHLLGEGVKIAAEKLGVPDLAMQVKGLGLAAYDPRGCKGMGLNYAATAEGASHMRGPTMGPEISDGSRLEDENKAKIVIDTQIAMAIVDSLCICSTMRFALTVERQLDFLRAVTGIEFTKDEATKVGKRILTLERMYNYREGFGRKDDYLPTRFLKEPLVGPADNQTVNIDLMLRDYYKEIGWDENGKPKEETLKQLSLLMT